MIELPPLVADLTRRHLALSDDLVPGLIEGLYVIGSAALGDFRPGTSDVDVVAVTSREPDESDLAGLAEVHTRLAGPAFYDGFYIARSALRDPPVDSQPVPFVVDGALHVDEPCGELTPVTWHALRCYGVAVRGPAVGELAIPPQSDDVMRDWLVGNLAGYWSGLADGVAASIKRYPADRVAENSAVEWTVLGPPRLHYTMLTGDITSKSGAHDHITSYFPDWSDLAHRALASRHGEQARFTMADLGAASELIRAVLGSTRALATS